MKMFKDLVNKIFRHSFVEENIKARLAFQIRALREKAGMSQPQLAALTGNTQSSISRIEDPTYGKFTLRTLFKVGAAFDVALYVSFVPFTKLVSEIEDVSPEALAVPSYAEEKLKMEQGTQTPRTYPLTGHLYDVSGQPSVIYQGSVYLKAFEAHPQPARLIALVYATEGMQTLADTDVDNMQSPQLQTMKPAYTLARNAQFVGAVQ